MRTVGVIPARYASSRLPGKPLMEIGGKPMVQLVYEQAKRAVQLDEVIVATDDKRIAEAVSGFGGEAVMTSVDHPNGTSRSAEAVKDMDVDIVINVQGDEPLISPEMIDELVAAMKEAEELPTATLCYEITEDKFQDPNVVKVVTDLRGVALYFSRSLIPFPRNREGLHVYEHLGIYGYTKAFLMRYSELPDTPLCKIESLEQLKVLEHGYRMLVIETKFPYEALSIDTKEDLEEARRIFEKRQR
jgi:3-deoxy-manno-octulosonate cytidylyltransferase (CMP-KDO synthetase)